MKSVFIKQVSKTFYFVIIFSLAACGGGGGGGGSSSSSAPTGVRVLHAAIEGSPVDLFSSQNSEEALQIARFGDTPYHAAASRGAQVLSLSLHLDPSINYFQAPVTIEKNQHISVLFYGNALSIGLNAVTISDLARDIPEGMSAIRVIHGLVGAASLRASIETEVLSSSVEFGKASDYIFTSSGVKTVVVRRTADGKAVFSGATELKPGFSYSVFMAGEIGYLTVGKILED